MAKELMDFELLQGTHTTDGSHHRPKTKSVTYVKKEGGPAVYLKDHRNLEQMFPNKFRRIYPEQMAAQLAAVRAATAAAPYANPKAGRPGEDLPGEDDGRPIPEMSDVVKHGEPPPAGRDATSKVHAAADESGETDVTDKFPTAAESDMKVYQLADHSYTIRDADDGIPRVEGLKGVIQVRKWLKDNTEESD